MDLALIALAGEQAGGTQHCLEFTVEYAKSRMQFGRAIGSFQAIKHMAANLLLQSEWAISAARDAAQQLADGAPDAGAAISLAAFACADAFSTMTTDSIFMHGGIGFTLIHRGDYRAQSQPATMNLWRSRQLGHLSVNIIVPFLQRAVEMARRSCHRWPSQ